MTSDPATPKSSKMALIRQKPTRWPYSCQAQLGMSGTLRATPPGGLTTVRGIGSSMTQCSTLTHGQTTMRAPSGSGRGRRWVMGT